MLAAEADAFVCIETHVKSGAALRKAQALCNRSGWAMHCAPAEQSKTSCAGSYGGIFAGIRKHLQQAPIATAKRTGAKIWQNRSAYATGFQVNMGGRPVTFLGGYCRGGAPEAVFKEVAAATAGGRRAFILAADFNQSPQQLARHPLLEKMGAGVVSTGRPTCRTKDGKESEIDFVIASKCLIGSINLKVCWEVPFGTHAALILKVNARPEAWSVLAPCAPKKLPEPVEKPIV